MMVIVHGSPLYQWDINRQLLIDSADLGSDFVIHCCYTEDANALVVEPKNVDDKVLVNIPNILLQKFGNLRVYVVTEGDTVYDATFYVMARPKPDDYVYTETEVLSYVSLSKRMDELERNSVSDEKISEAINNYLKENPITESDPTVPAWAKEPEKPKYTAKDIGALSQDELQNGVNLALKQAKESGEFKGDAFTYEDFTEEQLESLKGADGYTPTKGKDYFDGNDYVLTESDKQEIADMIEIPESGGTKDYTEFINKPKINGVELNGDLTPAELGLNGGSEEWEVIADITLEEETDNISITTDINGNPFEMKGFYIYVRCPIAATTPQSLNMFRVYYKNGTNPPPTPICFGGIGSATFFETMVCIELSNDYSPILQTVLQRTNKYQNFIASGQNGEFPTTQSAKGPITSLSFSVGMYYPVGTIIKVFKTR